MGIKQLEVCSSCLMAAKTHPTSTQLRTGLQHGYHSHCRTTFILATRHKTVFIRPFTSHNPPFRQHLAYGQWLRSNKSWLPAGHLKLRADRTTQIRSQSTAIAARSVQSNTEEMHDASQREPHAVRNAGTHASGDGFGNQGQETGVQRDQTLVEHHVTNTSLHTVRDPRMHPVELLDARSLSYRINNFLGDSSESARVYTCETFDRVLPKVAAHLGLLYSTPAPGQDRTGYQSILSKTEKTISAQDSPTAITAIIQAYSVGDHLDVFLTDIEAAVRGPYTRIFLDNHWRLLMSACRGYAEALPDLSIQSGGDLDASHAEQEVDGHGLPHLMLKNDRYGISIVQSLTSEPASFEKTLASSLLQYCQHIRRLVEPDGAGDIRFEGMEWQPAEFMGRAQRALGWGAITYSDDKIPSPSTATPLTEISRCEIHIGTRGLVGKPAVWFTRKQARLLGMLHTCVALKPALQSAYQAGTLLASDYKRFAQYWGETVPEAEHAADGERRDLSQSDVVTVPLNSAVIAVMLSALRRIRDLGFEGPSQWLSADETFERKMKPHNARYAIQSSMRHKYARQGVGSRRVSSDPKGPSLPILQPKYALSIRAAVSSSHITIIKAATGSGKTTQVPQLILENYLVTASSLPCNIVCTQPRRVAATSVARRVAMERGQELGNEVGYQVRFDRREPRAPSNITYVTSGYLLRLLEADPLETLSRYSHIVLDEVHERDTDTDLLLTALKNMFLRPLSKARRMPKVVLMSATIEPKFFEDYFRDSQVQLRISSIDVPGKTFPVAIAMLHDVLPRLENRYHRQMEELLEDEAFRNYMNLQKDAGHQKRLPMSRPHVSQHDEVSSDGNNDDEDLELIDDKLTSLHVPVHLLAFMVGDVLSTSARGDILVFLPGLGEIERLEQLLLEGNVLNMNLADDKRYRIHKLHSALYETNNDVFDPVPTGCRRIVLATNIAETSITLPQVRFVIDTGLSRQSSFDQATQAGSFGTRWISKAEVAQRRGRAGRTQPGTYIAAFAQGQYDLMTDKPIPELLRSNLDQIVLRTQVGKAFGMSHGAEGVTDAQPGQILTLAPSAPQADDITAAAEQLRSLHALAADGSPTPMGKIMSQFPTTPAGSKAILLGLVFRCLDPVIFMGCVNDDLPVMIHPEQSGAIAKVRRELAGTSDDDRHADWRGFALYDKARRKGRRQEARTIKDSHFIRHDTYCDIARTSQQVFDILLSMLSRNAGRSEDSLEQQNLPRPLFPSTPAGLNINSENENLVKALVLDTSGTRLGFWHKNNWRTALHKRILPTPKSVNHIHGGRKMATKRLRREPGDVLAYSYLRVTPLDKYPWACETLIVSPLTAMLFSQSLHLTGTETLVVNDWMRYQIELEESNAVMDPTRVAKIIIEYRKALDRFLAHAMSKIALEPHKLEMVQSGKMTANEFNVFFKGVDHPIRKIFVDSVVEILNINEQARKQRADQRIEEYRLQTEEPESQSSSEN